MVNNPFVIQQPQQQVDTSFLSGIGQAMKAKQDNRAEVSAESGLPQLSGISQQPAQQMQSQNMEQPNQEQQQSSQIIDSPIGSIAAAAIIKSINSRLGV